MTNNALVQISEFPLSAENLRSLPLEHTAAMSVLGFAISELNALRRIFLSQSHEYTGEKPIDEASSIQRLVVLRTWSSKLFEVRDFLQSLSGKKSLTDDPRLQELAEKALLDINMSGSQEGFEVARDVRHEASNHYLFEAAKKNIPHLHEGASLNFYIHEHGGNDFFPIGEAVMFHGRLHRRWKNVPSIEERRRKFDQWIEWCMVTNEVLSVVHANFAKVLVFEKLGRNSFYTKNYWVPYALVGSPSGRMTPVFFRKD